MRDQQNISYRDQRSSRASLVRLGDIGELLRGKGIPRSDLSDKGLPCLRYGEIYSTYDNTIACLKSRVAPEVASSAKALKTGDIVFAASGETLDDIGKAIAYIGPEPAYVGSDTVVLREHRQDPVFLAHALNSEHARRQKVRLGKGHSVVHIHVPDLSNVEILLLPLAEQRRVADIFKTWDDALEKLHVLRTMKERRLGALRASLLFGKLRLKGENRNWVPTRLAEVTYELTERNEGKALGREYVMGISNARGVVPMRKQTIADDISRYKRFPPNAFAYNPWCIDTGAIARNELGEEVLVSGAYVVFTCNAEGLDSDYLNHLRMTSWWTHYVRSVASGSVRMSVHYRDLATLKLPLPELNEQRAIATVLNTAHYDLFATKCQIDALTLQKHGLMQKLLTGEWRVNSKEISA